MKTKQLLYIPLLALSALMPLTACSDDADTLTGDVAATDAALTGDSVVTLTFRIRLPEDSTSATRGAYDHQVVKNLYFALYREAGTYPKYNEMWGYWETETIDERQILATNIPGYDVSNDYRVQFTEKTSQESVQWYVSIPSLSNTGYKLFFYAASDGAPYTFDPATGTISVDYDYIGNANLENPFMDDRGEAFYTLLDIDDLWSDLSTFHTGNGSLNYNGWDMNLYRKTIDVTLTRPFAQINVGTTLEDWNYADKHQKLPTSCSLHVTGVYQTLDLFTGEVSDKVDADLGVSYDHQYSMLSDLSFPILAEDGNSADYRYLAMAYVLVGDKQNSTVTFRANSFNDEDSWTVDNVPLQSNYQTNIYGNLLSYNKQISVDIAPAFSVPNSDFGPYEQLMAWAAKGTGTLELPGDVVRPEADYRLYITVPAGETAVLNLNGHSITQTYPIYKYGEGTLIINGPGAILGDDSPILMTGGGVSQINNCHMEVIDDTTDQHYTCVWTEDTGAIEIYSGDFRHYKENSALLWERTVGKLTSDGDYTTAQTIKVYGGNFYGYNPRVGRTTTSGGTYRNFVASGYKSVKTTQGSETVYVVKPNN